MAPTAGEPPSASGGRRFGRYELVGELGAGGMGVVLAARDPELERRVAIKILRPEQIAGAGKEAEHTVRLDGGGKPRDLVRERLLAEGRAMARLSHPNLLAVYEVGEVDGQIFLAMEHVEGKTLAAWGRAARRSWREIAGAYVQAGRGLAAAHAAGVVHGDFKPDNALVDETGRVRVIDFGVARLAGAQQARSLAGTPGFIAPEQHRGHPAGPLTDQFAFAVALYRELYDSAPYPEPEPGRDPVERFAGGPRPAPRGAAPRRFERILRRALSPDPADRHRSMDDLVAALEQDPGRRRRAVALAAIAITAVTGSLLLTRTGADSTGPSPECRGVAELAAGAWNPAERDRLRAAFVASGRPHAARSADLVAARLDGYAAEWRRERQAACDATFAGGGQSLELLGHRVECLDRRLAQLRAAADTLTRGSDGAVVDGAVRMATSLEPVADCARADALRPEWPMPADPMERAAVTRLTDELERATTELRAGRPNGAAVAATAVLAQAPLVPDRPPLFARASWVLGLALEQLSAPEQANSALVEALQLAERGRDGAHATRILIDLARVVGLRLRRPAEAVRLIGVAEAGLARVPADKREEMRLRLLQSTGDVAVADGRPVDAERAFRKAVELSHSLFEPDHLRISDAEARLAITADDLGRPAESRERNLRALAIRIKNLGPEHPNVAVTRNNLAESYRIEGNLEAARTQYQQCLAVLERIPNHREYPGTLTNLGLLELQAGNLDEAGRHIQQALARREQTLGPDHPDVANSLYNLGNVLQLRGEYRQALVMFQRALEIRGKRLGHDHAHYGRSLGGIAGVLLELGRWKEALDHAQRAVRVMSARTDTVDGYIAFALHSSGNALIQLGRPREAIADLERAMPARIEGPPARAETGFALARALWDSRVDRRRAVQLAREAHAVFAAGGKRWEREAARAERWLRAHATR